MGRDNTSTASVSSPHVVLGHVSGRPKLRKSGEDFADDRSTLLDGSIAVVTFLSRSVPNAPALGYASGNEIALPYAGVFNWRVGRKTTAIDANRVLYISRGQEFSETHPVKDRGHCAAVVTPTDDALDEAMFASDTGVKGFRTLSGGASPRAQLLSNLLLHTPRRRNELEADEIAVALLDELLQSRPTETPLSTRKVIARAKVLLHGWVGERFSLSKAASALNVSPFYLTRAFKLCEGRPLYQYYRALQLTQALQDIPDCDSLTTLALELGYSSHSHFTASFHRRYGVTPSSYRDAIGAKG